MKQPQPGDYGLTKIKGLLGFMVGFGQFLTGDSSKYTHAYVVLDDNKIIEAMPGGARITDISQYENKAIYSNIELTDEQRKSIVEIAKTYDGVGYSFLDYISLALLRFGIKPKRLRKFIENKGHMICSQLCDEVYRKAGIHLFNDGRLPQDVTPGDLLYVIAGEGVWINNE